MRRKKIPFEPRQESFEFAKEPQCYFGFAARGGFRVECAVSEAPSRT